MKRDLFSELTEGFQALKDEREGKGTLRQHQVELPGVAGSEAGEAFKKNHTPPV